MQAGEEQQANQHPTDVNLDEKARTIRYMAARVRARGSAFLESECAWYAGTIARLHERLASGGSVSLPGDRVRDISITDGRARNHR